MVSTDNGNFETETIIIAAGSEYSKSGVPGEEKLAGRGVSYCATCDGFFFRNLEVAVVAGGDTAITDALELSQHASKVYVIHRRDKLLAEQALQQPALANPKLKFIWNTVIEEIIGKEVVNQLRLRNLKRGELSSLKVAGVLVAVGLKPNSQCYSNIVELDNWGNIITDELMATSAPGIFAAGDIRRNSAHQIASAVGDGAAAAKSAFNYLQKQG